MRRHDRRRCRRCHVAGDGEGAEQEGQERRHGRGGADVVRSDIGDVGGDHQRGEAHEDEPERQSDLRSRQQRRQPAAESDKREGADARDAAAFGRFALAPSALKADEQADGERQPEAPEDLEIDHDLSLAEPSRRRTGAGDQARIRRDAGPRSGSLTPGR